MISISKLTVTTKQGATLLNEISATFTAGKIHVVVGPNGSGKTTLLRTICQLQHPYKGVIQIDGEAAQSLSEVRLSQKITWTESEHATTFAYSAEDVILWGRWPFHQGSPTNNDVLIARQAAEMLGISDKLSRPITTLSLGERKKVHLAKSIASEAPYMLWDEPCGPLDIRSALDLMKLSKIFSSQGRTIIMSLHDIGMALRCADSITILKDGKLAWSGLAAGEPCLAALNTSFNVTLNEQGYPLI